MISRSFWLCRFVKLPFGCMHKCLNRFLIVKFAKVHIQALHLHTQLHSPALLETEINCYNFPPSPGSAKCCEAPQTPASVGSIRTLKRTQSLTITSSSTSRRRRRSTTGSSHSTQFPAVFDNFDIDAKQCCTIFLEGPY